MCVAVAVALWVMLTSSQLKMTAILVTALLARICDGGGFLHWTGFSSATVFGKITCQVTHGTPTLVGKCWTCKRGLQASAESFWDLF